MLYKVFASNFQPSNEEVKQACTAQLDEVWGELTERLRARGDKRYLGGDEPGLEDFALCSLVALSVGAEQYACGRYTKWFNALAAQDAEWRAAVEERRRSELGQYVLRFYAEHRTAVREPKSQ